MAPDALLVRVGRVLDPVLAPLGFAPAQGGSGGDGTGQVIFCRGDEGSTDGGCLDLVLDLAASPDWHLVDVRYWGFTSDRWHLTFQRGAALSDQLADLAGRLPVQLV